MFISKQHWDAPNPDQEPDESLSFGVGVIAGFFLAVLAGLIGAVIGIMFVL